MPKKEIYLDNSATTRVWPAVVDEMEKYYLEEYGNPSSIHKLGEKARKAIDNARAVIAKEINAKPEEIVFTSSGTESNNLAILGLLKASKKKKIVISSIEHPSVNEVANYLMSEGYDVIKVGVDKDGILNLDELERVVDGKTALVSVIHGNNVIGAIQDLSAIGALCKKKEVLFHADCVQTFGKEKIDVNKMGISLLSGSAHKIGGPKGIGFLYVRTGIHLKPVIYGGGQERGLRSGTENVAGIMGFAKALELSRKVNWNKIRSLRDRLISGLVKIGGKVNGSLDKRLAGNVHVSFSGIDGETAVVFLSEREIYCSVGSACESNKEDKSILKAIGLNKEEIKGSIRFSLGPGIDEKDIEHVVKNVREVLVVLRF